VGLAVSEWSQTLIVFLSCSIPQCELDGLAIDTAVCDIVLEYCGHISLYQKSARVLR
jgi:hypothetical protein